MGRVRTPSSSSLCTRSLTGSLEEVELGKEPLGDLGVRESEGQAPKPRGDELRELLDLGRLGRRRARGRVAAVRQRLRLEPQRARDLRDDGHLADRTRLFADPLADGPLLAPHHRREAPHRDPPLVQNLADLLLPRGADFGHVAPIQPQLAVGTKVPFPRSESVRRSRRFLLTVGVTTPITPSMQTDLRHTPRSLRARLGLTQIDLATRARVADRTVRNLEDGLDVSLENLRAIAAALDVSPKILLDALEAERDRRARAGSAS